MATKLLLAREGPKFGKQIAVAIEGPNPVENRKIKKF
jgi:hypothetical protein